MFVLSYPFTFHAARRLDGCTGAASRLHGYTFTGEIFVEGQELVGRQGRNAPAACLVDATILASMAALVAQMYDHTDLNVRHDCPTLEVLARAIFDDLARGFAGPLMDAGCSLSSVSVAAGGLTAEYWPEPPPAPEPCPLDPVPEPAHKPPAGFWDFMGDWWARRRRWREMEEAG